MTKSDDFAQRIIRLRERVGTRLDLAYELGVEPMTVYRWEKGKVEPRQRIILRAIEKLEKKYSRERTKSD